MLGGHPVNYLLLGPFILLPSYFGRPAKYSGKNSSQCLWAGIHRAAIPDTPDPFFLVVFFGGNYDSMPVIPRDKLQ